MADTRLTCPHCQGGMTPLDHGICQHCGRGCGCSFAPESRSDFCEAHGGPSALAPTLAALRAEVERLTTIENAVRAYFAARSVEPLWNEDISSKANRARRAQVDVTLAALGAALSPTPDEATGR